MEPRDIVVLEDWEPRIDWLRGIVAKQHCHATIRPCLTHAQFTGSLAFYPPDLIILDHDLGEDPWTGYKAAQVLVEHHENLKHVPVLTWSQNPVGADSIASILTHYGWTVHKAMFGLQAGLIEELVLRYV